MRLNLVFSQYSSPDTVLSSKRYPKLGKSKKEIPGIDTNQINSGNSKNYNTVFLVLVSCTLGYWKNVKGWENGTQSNLKCLWFNVQTEMGGGPLPCFKKAEKSVSSNSSSVRRLRVEETSRMKHLITTKHGTNKGMRACFMWILSTKEGSSF